MAILKRVTITVERKVSDDNYGSYSAGAGEVLEIEDGDDAKEVKASARQRCRNQVVLAIREMRASEKK